MIVKKCHLAKKKKQLFSFSLIDSLLGDSFIKVVFGIYGAIGYKTKKSKKLNNKNKNKLKLRNRCLLTYLFTLVFVTTWSLGPQRERERKREPEEDQGSLLVMGNS